MFSIGQKIISLKTELLSNGVQLVEGKIYTALKFDYCNCKRIVYVGLLINSYCYCKNCMLKKRDRLNNKFIWWHDVNDFISLDNLLEIDKLMDEVNISKRPTYSLPVKRIWS